jgi:predicted nucleic acid-binding protein
MGLVTRIAGRHLGVDARRAFERAEMGDAVIHVPSMTLAEIMYLYERERISVSLSHVRSYLEANQAITIYPMSLEVVEEASQLRDVPELQTVSSRR